VPVNKVEDLRLLYNFVNYDFHRIEPVWEIIGVKVRLSGPDGKHDGHLSRTQWPTTAG
jgi:hypothetical protein